MMVCQVCRHEERRAIDRAIVQGKPSRAIAGLYGIGSKSSVDRHRECIAESLDKAGITSALTAKSVIVDLVTDLRDMAKECRNGVRDDFLRTADRLTRATEVFGKLTGEIQSPSVVAFIANLGVSGEAELRTALDMRRAMAVASLDDVEQELLAGMRFLLAERPQFRAEALAVLGAVLEAEVIAEEPRRLTNGNHA